MSRNSRKMTGKTHLSFALLIFLIAYLIAGFREYYITAGAILLGSLLPDIDSPDSFIGKTIPGIPKVINILFGHRGVFHSLIFLAICFLAALFVSAQAAIALAVGMASHLLLDALTVDGVPLLYPLKTRLRGFLRTGSLAEYLILALISLANAGILLYLV